MLSRIAMMLYLYSDCRPIKVTSMATAAGGVHCLSSSATSDLGGTGDRVRPNSIRTDSIGFQIDSIRFWIDSILFWIDSIGIGLILAVLD
jgi:hypothetical protein